MNGLDSGGMNTTEVDDRTEEGDMWQSEYLDALK